MAQTPETPQVLPPTIIGVPRPETPGSLPSPLLRNDPAAKSLEQTERFEPSALVLHKAEGRHLLTAGKLLVRDFGYDKFTADETLRLMQELGVNQMVTIPGSRPPCQVWLKDGKPLTSNAARQVFLPMIAANIRAEAVGGVWIVTDGARGFFDFGTDAEAARQAADLLIKHGFNKIGMIGSPRPTVMYPIFDKGMAERAKTLPPPVASSLGVLDDVAQKNLLLPGNVLAGPKTSLDPAQLQVVRGKNGEWSLMHNEETLGRFGSAEYSARGALKAIQDAKVTQMARIGTGKFPLFLADSQPMRGRPLGGSTVTFRPERLKLQQVRDRWWLVEDSRPMIDGGTKADAELLLKTVQHYRLTTSSQFGYAETGGLKFLTTGY